MTDSTRMRLAILVPAALLLAACDSTEPEPSLKGTWTGPTIMEGVTTNWTLEITDDAGGDLVGTIAFQDVGTPVSYNATLAGGTYSHPAVTFTFKLELGADNIDFRYQGNISATIGGETISASLRFTRNDES